MADLLSYPTARPLLGVMPGWLGAEDAVRIASYQLYESIYKNVPDVMKIIQRGSEANPIYIPSGKTIVEACNRYLAKRWTFAIDPRAGVAGDQDAVRLQLNNLFRREKVWSKFATQKRYGLIRGDSVWRISANPLKPAGTRISINEIDPAAYFPIEDPADPDRIVGCHIVYPLDDGTGKTVIRRETYRKTDTGQVTYELTWWEVAAWDDRITAGHLQPILKPAAQPVLFPEMKPVPPTPLPPPITTIPVYHIMNNREPATPFGSSELSGLERIIAGVNQSISDEELTLALEGLGLYVTTSGPPVDELGNEQNWKLGPGYVAEIDPAATWQRVNGVQSVTPMLDHIRYLEGAMRESSGTPDIAVGKVDVKVAESGISLQLQMAPILAKNEEKEQEMLAVTDHMLWDVVRMWLPAFEQLTAPDVVATSIVDDPLPINRAQVISEITALLGTVPPIITAEYARELLAEKLGYDFPEEIGNSVVQEAMALAAATSIDPFTTRMDAELAP